MKKEDIIGLSAKTGLLGASLSCIDIALQYIDKDIRVTAGLSVLGIILLSVFVYLLHQQVADIVVDKASNKIKEDLLKQLS